MKLMIYDLETRMSKDKLRGYRTDSIRWVRYYWYVDFIKPAVKSGEIHKRNQSVYLMEDEVYRKFKDASSNFKDTILGCIAKRVNSLKRKKFSDKNNLLYKLKQRKDWLMKNDFNHSFEFFEVNSVHRVNKKEVGVNVCKKSVKRNKRKENVKK